MSSGTPPRPPRCSIRFVVPNALPVEIQRTELLSLKDRVPKVTVLSAPSGYGKSTVLAQHARHTVGAVWVRLNEEAKDARSVLNDLAQSSAETGVTLSNWECLNLLNSSREQLLNALTEDLNEHETDLTFYLDGGEHLSTEAAQLLFSFAHLLGEGHRLILAQREGAAFTAAPFVARGEGNIITADQLRFTEAQTSKVAQQLGHVGAAADIQNSYQGWPWGIMLALHTQQTGMDVAATELARGVLSNLPESIVSALPAISILEFWSAESATNMGVSLPDRWIEVLQRAGVPMASVGRGRFVPHDVVRELLTEQLRQSPDQWKQMHARAAEQTEARGEVYSAIRHHVEAGQNDRAAHLAEQLSPRWYWAADWRLAKEALSLIPGESLSAELRSLYALAVLETGELQHGRQLLEAQLAAEPTATAHFGMSVVALRTENQLLQKRHLDAGLAIATQQRDIIQLLRTKAVYLQLNSSQKLEDPMIIIQEAIERAEGLGDASLRIATLSVRAWLLELQGEKESALREYERIYRAGMQLGLLHRLMPVVDRMASMYCQIGRTAEAIQMLEHFMGACERSYPIATSHIQMRLGSIYQLIGRLEEGKAMLWIAYHEHARQGHHSYMLNCLYHLYFAGVLGPERAQSLEAFDQLRTLMGEDRNNLSEGTWTSLQEMHAYAAYTAGHFDQALGYLDAAAESSQRMRENTCVLTELLRSEIHRQRGQLSSADASRLRHALDAKPEDLIDLIQVSSLTVSLVQEYVERGWEAQYFRGVLRELSTVHATEPIQMQLHLTTFGVFTATLGTHSIKLGHSSALEALTYWMLHPEARQDELADQVWEHGDLKRARQSAQVARSTINTAFREATVQDAPMIGDLLISARRGRKNPQWALNPRVELTSDVHAFLSNRSPTLLLRIHPESFLAGSENEWVTHYRQVLRTHAVQVLEDAAKEAEPMTALTYLVRAADLTQEREGYEKVRRAAQSLGHTDLSHAAQQAMLDLERGKTAALGQRWAVN